MSGRIRTLPNTVPSAPSDQTPWPWHLAGDALRGLVIDIVVAPPRLGRTVMVDTSGHIRCQEER